MTVTGTHVAYYFTCHRKLWLFANGINMEHTSDLVTEGKLIGETSYKQRAEKYTEVELPGGKIDFYDAKTKTVHEVKKSDKVKQSHIAQVQYYLYLLEEAGVKHPSGLLEYPKLRKTEVVQLNDQTREGIAGWISDIEKIVAREEAPARINARICKKCSYFDFCYVEEIEG